MELKLTHVTKQYGTKAAVDHINMTLREGIYGLLGANGAGKTSLMRLVCLNSKKKRRRNYSGWPGNPGNGEEYRSLLDICRSNFGYYPVITALEVFTVYV